MRGAGSLLKHGLARMLRWSGLNYVAGSLRSQVAILTYHRVLPAAEAARYPFPGMVISTAQFESHVKHLARSYRVLDFPAAIESIRSGSIPSRAVVVTFDDGYYDNFEHAFPILQKYGVPATFFVVSGAIDGKSVLWWDAVVHAVSEITGSREQNHALPEGMPGWLEELVKSEMTAGDPAHGARRLVEQCNALPRPERKERLQALFAAATPPSCGRLMMTWDQIRSMKRAGMQVGAHTVTHDFMDELDEPNAREEVERCFEVIESQTGRDLRLFAFPRGRCTPALKKILARAGVEAAVTTAHGLNGRQADPFMLRRIDGGYCHRGGTFDPAVFDAELGGWFSPFRRRSHG